MLTEAPHAEYNVTQSYGLCIAILAWVMQRIRTPEDKAQSPEDRAAISVKKTLNLQRVDALPWGLRTDGIESKSPDHGDFKGFTAFNFLKWLRDASCHGDARQIAPVNHGNKLMGFEFRAKGLGDDRARCLVLTESDLRRIGGCLAAMYCEALQSAASPPSDHFIDDARSMREQRKAA
jgi:hypothetical protein